MDLHVKVLAAFYLIFGVLGILGSLMVLLIFGGAAGIISMAGPQRPGRLARRPNRERGGNPVDSDAGAGRGLLQRLPKTAAMTPPPMAKWTLASSESRQIAVRSKMVVLA